MGTSVLAGYGERVGRWLSGRRWYYVQLNLVSLLVLVLSAWVLYFRVPDLVVGVVCCVNVFVAVALATGCRGRR